MICLINIGLFISYFCKLFTSVNSKAVSNAAVSQTAVSTDSFTAFPHAVLTTVPPTVSHTIVGTVTKFAESVELVSTDFDLTGHLTCHAGTKEQADKTIFTTSPRDAVFLAQGTSKKGIAKTTKPTPTVRTFTSVGGNIGHCAAATE